MSLKCKKAKKSFHTRNKRDWKKSSWVRNDGTECRGIRDIENLFKIYLFDEIDEDYYKTAKTKCAFNVNYIEYEGKGEKDKNLLPKEYLDMIIPYLSDIINDHKTQSECKIQLAMQINFVFSKDSEETRPLHTKSYKIEIMMGNKTDEIIEKLFESLTKLSKRFRKINERKRVCSW